MSGTLVVISDDSTVNVDLACNEIGSAWHSTIDSLFRVVGLIRQCLGKKGFKELQTELDKRGIMKSSVFSMFKSIAENDLIEPSIKEKLPPAYNTLYYISKIDNKKVLNTALDDGVISATTTIEEAKKFYKSISGESKDTYDSFKPDKKIINLASVKVSKADYKKNKTEILSLLNQLEGLGVIIKLNEDL